MGNLWHKPLSAAEEQKAANGMVLKRVSKEIQVISEH